MTTFDELLAIDWPDEFLVEYPDGPKALLLRNDGVALMPPGDDPEGCGALSAGLPKKHPRNQKQGNRLIRFSELRGSTPEMDVGFGRRVDLASGAMPTLAVGM